MSEERAARIGHNEALYRQVNERIQDIHDVFEPLTEQFSIVCECGDLTCMQQTTVSREAYERARGNPSQFIVVCGHEVSDVEEVVQREQGYQIVEKATPAARRVAEELDPRS